MTNKNIFADQSTIQINVMKVDGKKLTKSLIDQIPGGFPFDAQYNFTGDKIFGFAKTGKPDSRNPRGSRIYTVIAQKQGKLIKFDEFRLTSLTFVKPTTSLSDFSLRAIKEIIGEDESLYVINPNAADEEIYNRHDPNFTIEKNLSPYGLEKFFGIIEKVKLFYNELQEHQIFI